MNKLVSVFASDPIPIKFNLLFSIYHVVSFYVISFTPNLFFPYAPPISTWTPCSPISSEPAVLPNIWISSALIPPCSLNLLYLISVYHLMQTNLIIVFHYILSFYCIVLCSTCVRLILCPSRLLSNPPSLTSVWLWSLKIIGQLRILCEWVQHMSWSQVLSVTSDYLLTLIWPELQTCSGLTPGLIHNKTPG